MVSQDEAIGGGTGYFECVELFRCAPNHAGLLPLSVCMKETDMDDEENNTLDTENLGLQQSSFEPQQQQEIHKNMSSLQAGSFVNEKENKETSRFPQFTIGKTAHVKFCFQFMFSSWIYFQM